MKKSLRLYNQLTGNDPVDRSPFWIFFGMFIGFSAGLILAKLISL